MNYICWGTIINIFNRSYLYRSICASVVFTALSGCAVAPQPILNSLTPENWRNTQRPLSPQASDLKQWWHAFNDPKLNELVDKALQNNLDVAEAVERLRAIRVLSKKAQSPYLPSLSINTRDSVSPDTRTSYFLIGFDSIWELPLFGAKQSADRLAKGNHALFEAQLRTVQVTLVAEVSRRWIELRTAQQTEQTLAAIRDIHRDKLNLMQVRETLALEPRATVAMARAELAHAEMALTGPRQQINRSAQQLAILTGQTQPDPLWLTPGAPPKLGQWQLGSLPADLLRTRPEISSAEALVIVAAGELGMSEADIYPHISLGASLQWSLNVASNRRHTPNGNSIFSFGPGISIPLFDWGIRVANAKAKNHQMRAAVFAYRKSILEGIAETEIAMGNLEQLRISEQSSRQAYTCAQTRVDGQQLQTDLGFLSKLDLSSAQLDKLRAQQQLDQISAERNIAYVSLYKALGGAPLPMKEAD
ncbi:RND transporter [Pseudomonas fluorescens]|jgi:NodT family efflux transporter outer membrane factor (OMF) lipoprotein|uniref:TolC family protein n=1 Tax=Pseudomonas TaxID=286 RepID=UPI00084B433C|nr:MULTISPECIES: TolC family protein [Pseudomonas]OEC70876.1 RND transporter [Pseudomonas sp. AP19]OPB02111.1 RND transporter [Pseudomonas fluorescens]